MGKILKKYTTIPQHLYVDRYADVQLKRIIEEMQRPGYVLVARQMGKTNLLFNAKRTLENENRLFAYVDLSNLYDNERDCYRNIINCIIEPNLSVFESLEEEINIIRKKELPAHNEYSRSLVKILNFFVGDLVIILDEIDALKSVGYSDNIFAQIRSNYFSRTNFPVLNRLTYVLSGVIEPTELIKDKNKSPFNIGDKIYLDDFNKEEHIEFIKKSKLNISKEISEEIFKWTNGNPRLTFDVCAEVENFIINEGEIDILKLNTLIERKYLTTFDIAPVDHIRELVKSNREVRKGILNIYKNNHNDLSDDLKKKLYLFGVINSNFNEKTKIKNKIIEKSLSEDWLLSIEKEKENSFVYAIAKYTDEDFNGAIRSFVEVLNNPKNDDELEGSHYFLGMCHYKMGEFELADKYFSYEFTNNEYFFDALCFLGVCKMALDHSDGISILEQAVKNKRNNYAYHVALLNLAVNIEDDDRSINLLNELFDSTFDSKDVNSDLNETRTLSLFYKFRIIKDKYSFEEAFNCLEQALKYSNEVNSLYLLYTKYQIQKDKDETLKTKICKLIVDGKLKFSNVNDSLLSFSKGHLYLYLDFLFNVDNNNDFFQLLDYTRENLLKDIDESQIIYEVTGRKNSVNRLQLLNYLIDNYKNDYEDLYLKVYRDILLIYIDDNIKFLEIFDNYLIEFKKIDIVETDDIYVFILAIRLMSESNKLAHGLQLCYILKDRVDKQSNHDLSVDSIILYYWFAVLYYSLNNKVNSMKYANICLDMIDSTKATTTSVLDEEGLRSIQEQLNKMKMSFIRPSLIPIIKSDKKYSRNDWVNIRYNDSLTILKKKYKQIEADLKKGNCSIVD